MNIRKQDMDFIVLLAMQLLHDLSRVPCSADINFAKKASIMKRNRYKDRFPSESHFFSIHPVLITAYACK